MSLHLLLQLRLGRVMVGVRRFAARHRLARWVPIVVCCGGLVFAVHTRTEQVDAARARWSDVHTVWAAAHAHRPGDELVVESVDVPAVAVPDGAADAVPDGSVARQQLSRGEIVTTADLGGDGPLALVPDDHRALAVRESVASGAQVGERVDVVSDGLVITARALVLAVLDDAVLVAVPTDDAANVALASDSGVTLLRSPD